MGELVRKVEVSQIKAILLSEDRRIWLDHEDAQEMAENIFDAGFRMVENDG